MRLQIGRLLAAALAAAPLFGSYVYESSVVFSGATGSTQTNITLLFSFNDAKLRTSPNGGQIQNLCTRNGNSVPCDFIFTNDTTCASLTGGYKWGFDGDYSASAGTGHGWLLIPSYTTSGVTPTVCVGNSAVSTYQGGAAGAEFDSGTLAVYHFADGVTLSATDFSAGSVNGTIHSATAVAGQVDGAASFSGSSQYISRTLISTPSALTVEFWAKSASSPALAANTTVYNSSDTNDAISFAWNHVQSQFVQAFGMQDAGGTYHAAQIGGTLSANTWYHIAGTWNGTTLSAYKNGTVQASTAASSMATESGSLYIGAFSSGVNSFTGSVDELRVSNVARSANWIATEYANQGAPPSIGIFVNIGGGGAQGGGAQVVGAAVY